MAYHLLRHLWRMIHFGTLIVSCTAVLSCSLSANLFDTSSVAITFESPAQNKFTNQTTYDFKVKFDSNSSKLSADKAMMQIFEGESCELEKKISERTLSSDNTASMATNLQDGKKYSARVYVAKDDKILYSECSPWVGVDLLNPDPVNIQHPIGDSYVSSKQFLAAWTESADNGISGLRDDPYVIRLYGQASCSGPALQQADSRDQQHTFENLTHGIIYSVQISAVDNAGNESALSCSPYTEIDVYAPGFRFHDPTSSTGYTRTTTPQVQIDNDSSAGYWCFTNDVAFIPTSHTDPCPGGSGASNGWHTSRPSSFTLTAGDGLKSYYLWIFRPNGVLISNKQASAAITLDQTPPGVFSVQGVGSSDDEIFDEWLTSLGQVRVKWNSSTDAAAYDLEIRNQGGTVICSESQIPAGSTSYTFGMNECSPLLDSQIYEIRMTSYDAARNTRTTNFNFEVDLVPSEPFSILGIAGGNDIEVDQYFGAGLPTLHFEESVGASHYEVEVRDIGDVLTCTLATKAAPTAFFDYSSESGVACLLLHGATYRAFVTALDDGKNRTASTNFPFTFQVDTQAPFVVIDSATPALTNQTSAAIHFRAEDSISGIKDIACSVDSSAYAACTSPVNLTSLSEGNHSISIRARDKAGNSNTENHAWAIDLTGPTTNFTAAPSGSQSSNAATFAFSAVDVGPAGVQKYECSLNAAIYADCISPVNATSLPEGSQTFAVRAIDNLGNVGAAIQRSFVTDYTAPALAITSGPAHPTDHDLNASISFNTSDAGSGLNTVECSIDGGAFSTCTSPAGFSGLSAGPHTVTIRATDNAGLFTTATHSWTIYTYSWDLGAFSACSAAQPVWDVGVYGGCSAAQPAFTYDTWGSCSATCGGGTQNRGQSCPVVGGNETRSVSCPTTNGIQNRTVTCLRNDGTPVADGQCLAAKPATTQACSRNDCAGAAPANSQACSRGGGSDCHSAQPTSQSCNTHSCVVTCAARTVTGFEIGCGNNGSSQNLPTSNSGHLERLYDSCGGYTDFVCSNGTWTQPTTHCPVQCW